MSMLNQIRQLACVAAIGIAVLGPASPAQAAVTVTIIDLQSVNGGTFTTVATSGPLTGLPVTDNQATVNYTGTGALHALGNFTGVSISVTPQLSTGQYVVFDSEITAHDTTTGIGKVDQLEVIVSISGVTSSPSFPYPTGPVSLSSSLSSSSLSTFVAATTSPAKAASGFTTFSSTINPQGPVGPAFSSPGTGTLTGFGAGVGHNITGSPLSTSTTGNASSSYVLANVLNVFLTNSGSANVNGTTTVTALAPEPSTMVMALSGGILMVLGGWVRQRKRS